MRAWAYEIWRFDGRIGRRQFWNGVGLLLLAYLGLSIIGGVCLAFMWILFPSGIGPEDFTAFLWLAGIWTSYLLLSGISLWVLPVGPLTVLLVPVFALELYWLLALCAKRWHDLGRSGWWSIGLVAPLILARLVVREAVQIGFDGLDAGGVFSVIILLVCAVFFVWALVLLGVVKGRVSEL